MRYGVDGEAGEGGARLGTIGRDHLSYLGHQFGRNNQLRYHRPGRAAWDAVVGHGEHEPPARADPLYARQRLTERVWRGIGLSHAARTAVPLGRSIPACLIRKAWHSKYEVLVNRIGRRTIFAMLLIAAVVAIWALLGGR
jgi:hypothetical protein